MTTLKKTVIGAALTVALGAGIYHTRVIFKLNEQNRTLQQQAASAGQIQELQNELDNATNRLRHRFRDGQRRCTRRLLRTPAQ